MAKQKCWKLVPCNFYDLERLESWLRDMAAQGWHQRRGKMVGRFERDAPKAVRYRLQPKNKWYDGRTPDSDMVELFQSMGWEFVTAHGDFYIFSTEDAAAPELNTEPKLMAHGFTSLVWAWAFNVLLYGLLMWNGTRHILSEPVRFLMTFGPVYTVSYVIILTAAVVTMAQRCVQLIRYRRQLIRAKELDHCKPWKKGALRHQISRVLFFVLWAMVMVLLAVSIFASAGEKDIAQYPGKPPIVTMADLYPEGEYDREDWLDYYNTYGENESSLATVFEWRENGQVMTPDGEVIRGFLIVHYYETAYPWLAKGLARELEREIQRNKRYEPMELPELGLDQVSGYTEVGYRVILRQGNTVIDATLDTDIAVLWLEMMAERLR